MVDLYTETGYGTTSRIVTSKFSVTFRDALTAGQFELAWRVSPQGVRAATSHLVYDSGKSSLDQGAEQGYAELLHSLLVLKFAIAVSPATRARC